MFKRLLTLTICVLASTGLALASQPECLPVTVVLSTAVHYTVQNCISYGLLPGLPSACLNCPGEEAHVFNQTHPVCVQGYRDYLTRTVPRHLVNGRCVPIETAMRAPAVPAPRTDQPVAAAPPPMGAVPVARPRIAAPPPAPQAPWGRSPQGAAAPHFAPPAPPPSHAVPQGGRPQP